MFLVDCLLSEEDESALNKGCGVLLTIKNMPAIQLHVRNQSGRASDGWPTN